MKNNYKKDKRRDGDAKSKRSNDGGQKSRRTNDVAEKPRRTKEGEPKGHRINKHTDINGKVTVQGEDLLDTILAEKKNPLFLILDRVQDPHNLGACMRSSDGAGVDAILITKDRSVSLTDTVRSVSCGASESVPLIQVTNLSRTMKRMQDAGVWIIGTSDQTEQGLYDTDLKGPVALALGAEGTGLRRLTMENCDYLVKIPMLGEVPCLNVSVATGVCLYEAVRQRSLIPAE